MQAGSAPAGYETFIHNLATCTKDDDKSKLCCDNALVRRWMVFVGKIVDFYVRESFVGKRLKK